MGENNGRSRDWLVGLVLIVLGVAFLLGQFFNISIGDAFWPLFIIIPGVILYVLMSIGGRNANFLAIPATMITTVGLILFVQNTFDIFETWAYAWSLVFPTSFGLGLYLQGSRNESVGTRDTGRGFVRTGLILFAVFFVIFEMVIGLSGLGLSQFGLPVLLILLGMFLLFRRGRRSETAAEDE